MTACRTPGNAELLWIDPVFRGAGSDEANCAVHIFEDLGNRELRLAAMRDRKNGLPTIKQVAEARDDPGNVVRGEPPAAYHKNDSDAVGVLFRAKNIHRERHSKLVPIDEFLA